MPVIVDPAGNVYRIPPTDLAKYKLSPMEAESLRKQGLVPDAALDGGGEDVELQEMRPPRVSMHAYNWYSGD